MTKPSEERRALLRALITSPENTSKLAAALASHGWDSRETLASFGRHDASRALELFVNGQLDAQQLEEWATTLEVRDDLTFDDRLCHDLIHEIANPTLTRALTQQRAAWWLAQLAEPG